MGRPLSRRRPIRFHDAVETYLEAREFGDEELANEQLDIMLGIGLGFLAGPIVRRIPGAARGLRNLGRAGSERARAFLRDLIEGYRHRTATAPQRRQVRAIEREARQRWRALQVRVREGELSEDEAIELFHIESLERAIADGRFTLGPRVGSAAEAVRNSMDNLIVIQAIIGRRRRWFDRLRRGERRFNTDFGGLEGGVREGDPTRLGPNMLRAEGLRNIRNSWTGFQAHHVIPSELRDLEVLQRIRIDLDHASNGEFLPAIDELAGTTGRARHVNQHQQYTEAIRLQLRRLDPNADRDLLIRQVIAIRERAREGILRKMPIRDLDPRMSPNLWNRWMQGADIPGL